LRSLQCRAIGHAKGPNPINVILPRHRLTGAIPAGIAVADSGHVCDAL
jgi:O6-methylguanine-DNA--protein-cysteine methyltransferase